MALLKTIKEYLAVVGIKPNDLAVMDKRPIMTDESEDAVSVRTRLNKSFQQQQQQLQSRALIPHGADCPDPLSCIKSVCFVWESDKIVK